MNKKKLWIIIGIVAILLVVAVGIILLINFLPQGEDEYSDTYLPEEKYSVSIEDFLYAYTDDQMAAYDEQGNKINSSEEVPFEKLIFDNKVGMYGFNLIYDMEDTVITYTIKNHTKENIEAFNYRLQLVNSVGQILGSIDLESKELPALSKYDVTLTVDEDVTDIYDITPVTDLNVYGKVGGGNSEIK